MELYLKAILTGFTVGFLEEIFFRGIIFRGLLEDWKPLPAFVYRESLLLGAAFRQAGENNIFCRESILGPVSVICFPLSRRFSNPQRSPRE